MLKGKFSHMALEQTSGEESNRSPHGSTSCGRYRALGELVAGRHAYSEKHRRFRLKALIYDQIEAIQRAPGHRSRARAAPCTRRSRKDPRAALATADAMREELENYLARTGARGSTARISSRLMLTAARDRSSWSSDKRFRSCSWPSPRCPGQAPQAQIRADPRRFSVDGAEQALRRSPVLDDAVVPVERTFSARRRAGDPGGLRERHKGRCSCARARDPGAGVGPLVAALGEGELPRQASAAERCRARSASRAGGRAVTQAAATRVDRRARASGRLRAPRRRARVECARRRAPRHHPSRRLVARAQLDNSTGSRAAAGTRGFDSAARVRLVNDGAASA